MDNSEFISISGINIKGILSRELFLDSLGFDSKSPKNIAVLCHDIWTDFADSIADLNESLEAYLVIATVIEKDVTEKRISLCFLNIGRDKDPVKAQSKCRKNHETLWKLLTSTIFFIELENIRNEFYLRKIINQLTNKYVIEIKRRIEDIKLSEGSIRIKKNIGFLKKKSENAEVVRNEKFVQHLFPWIPSDNNWVRLMELLLNEEKETAYILHFQGLKEAPEECLDKIIDSMISAEKIIYLSTQDTYETYLHKQTQVLLDEIIYRRSILEKSLIIARLFIASTQKPSPALLSIVESSIDDASIKSELLGMKSLFFGGSIQIDSNKKEIFSPFKNFDLEILFSPKEVTSILRTSMPNNKDFPGLYINRFRTAPVIGKSGNDFPLGNNIYKDKMNPVNLDKKMRFRHTYIIGQTGTGKSNLMLHMILHDIKKGRGVAVLDPHGPLIDQVLLNFPENRKQDLILIDVTDAEKPIGFNILCINETEPFQYLMSRNLLIDDLYTFIDSIYNLKQTGGPIFETHFRGMLGLLLGFQPQQLPLIPNLMIFRMLYTNRRLRNALVERIKGKDLVINDFVQEAISSGGEASLANMATYITSKFSRFISDTILKNITCQNRILDIEKIINENKVLLFYLGKGKFGEKTAGLLASQVVSRIKKAVMMRKNIKKINPFYLYADEFQIFADRHFSELLAESRKFKLSLTLAHQYAYQLPPEVMNGVLGNVGTIISFRIGAPDSEKLESIFKPSFMKRDLTSLPNFQAYIRSFGNLGSLPFSIKTLAPPDNENYKLSQELRELSRRKYGTDRNIVEREIRETYDAYKNFKCEE